MIKKKKKKCHSDEDCRTESVMYETLFIKTLKIIGEAVIRRPIRSAHSFKRNGVYLCEALIVLVTAVKSRESNICLGSLCIYMSQDGSWMSDN